MVLRLLTLKRTLGMSSIASKATARTTLIRRKLIRGAQTACARMQLTCARTVRCHAESSCCMNSCFTYSDNCCFRTGFHITRYVFHAFPRCVTMCLTSATLLFLNCAFLRTSWWRKDLRRLRNEGWDGISLDSYMVRSLLA